MTTGGTDLSTKRLEGCLKYGYLTKQGRERKSWKKRYFNLNLDYLSYHETRFAAPKGVIAMSEYVDCQEEDVILGGEFRFILTLNTRMLLVRCVNREEMMEWLKSIRAIGEAHKTSRDIHRPFKIPATHYCKELLVQTLELARESARLIGGSTKLIESQSNKEDKEKHSTGIKSFGIQITDLLSTVTQLCSQPFDPTLQNNASSQIRTIHHFLTTEAAGMIAAPRAGDRKLSSGIDFMKSHTACTELSLQMKTKVTPTPVQEVKDCMRRMGEKIIQSTRSLQSITVEDVDFKVLKQEQWFFLSIIQSCRGVDALRGMRNTLDDYHSKVFELNNLINDYIEHAEDIQGPDNSTSPESLTPIQKKIIDQMRELTSNTEWFFSEERLQRKESRT
ncbi:pleckstrin domain-containing protein [Planoprotostelium fungivorum]|uniref:Pleckstrin domain-containing protein n=1 Tax=Planoprotostelium fungivorum TaxID=1890364 RepID=A0A2P6NAG0_9EUKA|nr:pleckstrin domain-containing protein [Planoprotostelium fungivorum]